MEKKNKKSKLKFLLIILLLVICTVFLAIVFVSPTLAAMKYYKNVAKDKVEAAKGNFTKRPVGSVVYDKNDEEIIRFSKETGNYYITANNFTDPIRYAFVVLEDDKFFEKKGAKDKDLFTITSEETKASNLVNGISNITRKMARDFVLEDIVDMNNPLLEVYVANELEKVFSKDQLLEYYINNLFFEDGIIGAQTAAKAYFSKDLVDLTPGELGYLAAIAADYTVNYNAQDRMDVLAVRRNTALDRMYEAGVITREEYFKAISDEVVLKDRDIKKYNYVEKFVLRDAIHTIMANDGFVFTDNFESEEKRKAYNDKYNELYDKVYKDIFKNGYNIYTSFDMDLVHELQLDMDSLIANSNTKVNGTNALSGGAVLTDNETGYILAITGGESVESEHYVYNRAYESDVSLGRVVWPLDIYVPYISWHHDPSYIVYAKQAVDGTLIDKVTLREAIASYDHDFAMTMYEQNGKAYVMSLLNRSGFANAALYTAAYPENAYISGSMLEVAGAYMMIANDGTFVEPTCIRKIDLVSGLPFVTPDRPKQNIYAANDDRIMVDILADNFKENGMLSAYASDEYITAGFADGGVLAGFTTDYTLAVYNSYEGIALRDIPENERVNHNALSGHFYKNVMKYLYKDKEKKEFEKAGPYSKEEEPVQKDLEPTTERPSLGGEGGHPEDGDDKLNNNLIDYNR